jgi:HD-GYP domain-containing protein (c-di-GMP phosphodiesterase class II)
MQGGMLKDKIEDMVTRMARAVQVTRIYGKDHALTREAVDSLHKILSELLVQKEDITLGIIGDELAFEKEPLYELSVRRKGFIGFLKTIGVKKWTFSRGVDRAELLGFCQALTSQSDPFEPSRDLPKALHQQGIRHIQIGELGVEDKKLTFAPPEQLLRRKIKLKYEDNIKLLTQTFQELKGNQPLNVQSARQIVDSLLKNMLQNKNLLLLMTSLKSQDENTFMHGVNVSIFTLLQAEVLGIEEKYLVDMGLAAMLHDVGKLTTTLEEEGEMSAWKAGPEEPTPENKEQKRIRQDVAGAKILLETDGIHVLAAITAFEHNIKYDMSGPQMKLYGKKLNLVSMMVAISDYYDQLRRKPSFYQAGGPEHAYEEMNKLSGTYFHPDLLKNFFSVIGVYPPGTLVEMDTKEIALVIQASMLDIRRPQVEILYDANGEKYKEPKIVNLVDKDKRGQYKRSVVKSIAPVDRFEIPGKYT